MKKIVWLLLFCGVANAQTYNQFHPGGNLGATYSTCSGASTWNCQAIGTIDAFSVLGNGTNASARPVITNPLTLNLMTGSAFTAQVVATSNITLSGSQTIDGVSVGNGEIVLAVGKSTASQNGLWKSNASDWSRPPNFPSAFVIPTVCNIDVLIQSGTVGVGTSYTLNTASTITIDTTSQTWALIAPVISAAGATGAIQYNNAGLLAGSNFFTSSGSPNVLTLGDSTVTNPGSMTIQGSPGSGAGSGSAINFHGGDGSSGGTLNFRGGNPQTSGGTVGALIFAGGTGNGTTGGGQITFSGGPAGATANGGAVTLQSGAGGATSGNSGNVTISSRTVTDGNTGNITLTINNAATTSATARNGGSLNASVGNGVSGGSNGAMNFTSNTVNLLPKASPAPSGTGAGTILAGSTNNHGGVIGNTLSTAITITFSAPGFTNVPACVATDNQASLVSISSVSISAVTFAVAALTGDLYYQCF